MNALHTTSCQRDISLPIIQFRFVRIPINFCNRQMLRDSMRGGVCQCHAVMLRWAAGQLSDAPLHHHCRLARHYRNSQLSASYVSWTPEQRKQGFKHTSLSTPWQNFESSKPGMGKTTAWGPWAARLAFNLALWTCRNNINNRKAIK